MAGNRTSTGSIEIIEIETSGQKILKHCEKRRPLFYTRHCDDKLRVPNNQIVCILDSFWELSPSSNKSFDENQLIQEPKSLSEAKRIIEDMMQTVSNEGTQVDVDTMRYCAQVLHNLLAAYTLTDKESAQKHVSLISKLMNAPSDVIYASEGNYSTSRTLVTPPLCFGHKILKKQMLIWKF